MRFCNEIIVSQGRSEFDCKLNDTRHLHNIVQAYGVSFFFTFYVIQLLVSNNKQFFFSKHKDSPRFRSAGEF